MRYFTPSFEDKNIKEIEGVIFGSLHDQRKSVDKKYFICSLYDGDKNNYDFMNHLKEYTYEEILKEINTPLWIIETLGI